MYMLSYTRIYMYIPANENKTKHRPDSRHHRQEVKKKDMAKSDDPNSDCDIEIFLQVWKIQ